MRAALILCSVLAACAVDPDVTLRGDDASVADAQPMTDAAPTPDADPAAPDAPPRPDAAPGSPDAGPPDAGSPDAAAPRPIGWPVKFSGGEILIPADALFGFAINVDAPVTLQTWGVIPSDAGTTAKVKMALYPDDAGAPGTLVTWTGVFDAANQTEAASGTPLAAGDYWLALVTDAQMGIRQSSAETVGYCVRSFTFSTAFGSTYGTPASCTTTDALNIYIIVLEQ